MLFLHSRRHAKETHSWKHAHPETQKCSEKGTTDPWTKDFSDQLVCSTPGRHCNGRGQQIGNLPHKGSTVFYDAASSKLKITHQVSFTGGETQKSMLSFERESAADGVTIKGYNTDNGVYTAKEILERLETDSKTLRLSGVGAHHQNGPAENAIKNVSRRARIFMFHAAIRWPESHDKSLWPFAMDHAVHLHNHTPRRLDKFAPIEIWSQSRSTHSQLVHAHPWGVPVYVLDPTLQDGFKMPKFNPRARKGIYLGPSPLHASSVGMTLNPKTSRISPQFHCIHDDYFETVACNAETSQKKMDELWDEVAFEGCERVEMELDHDDPTRFKNDWDFPGNEDETSQLKSQDPPHVVKEPPMPVPSVSKSPHVEDSAHSPTLNDSSPMKDDVPKADTAKQRELASDVATPKQRESITVDESPDAGTHGLKDPELKRMLPHLQHLH